MGPKAYKRSQKVLLTASKADSGGITSVIGQKYESQNGCFKKTKYAKFSEKRTFLTPWYAHAHWFAEQINDWFLYDRDLCHERFKRRNVRWSLVNT